MKKLVSSFFTLFAVAIGAFIYGRTSTGTVEPDEVGLCPSGIPVKGSHTAGSGDYVQNLACLLRQFNKIIFKPHAKKVYQGCYAQFWLTRL